MWSISKDAEILHHDGSESVVFSHFWILVGSSMMPLGSLPELLVIRMSAHDVPSQRRRQILQGLRKTKEQLIHTG